MLTILFIFFIGRHFFTLAEEYNKNKWLFAIIGVVVYYVGSAIGGIIMSVFQELFGFYIDWGNQWQLLLIGLLFGFGSVFLFSYILRRHFEETKPEELPTIEDIGRKTKDQEDRDRGFKF